MHEMSVLIDKWRENALLLLNKQRNKNIDKQKKKEASFVDSHAKPQCS